MCMLYVCLMTVSRLPRSMHNLRDAGFLCMSARGRVCARVRTCVIEFAFELWMCMRTCVRACLRAWISVGGIREVAHT